MKILFYSSYFYPYISGITVYPGRLLKHLSQRNEITVTTFPHSENLKKNEKVERIEIKRIPYSFKISKGYISPQSIPLFLKEVRKNDIIIINIPNFEALPLAILGRIMGKKVVALFCCQVFLGKDIFSKTINFFLNTSVLLQLILAHKVIAFPEYTESLFVNKFIRNKLSTSLPLIEKKPLNKLTKLKFKKEKEKKIWVGFVGRIAREKGIEYLIKAIENLTFKSNIVLVFAGPYGSRVAGERAYYLKILKLLKKKKIQYKFFGKLTDRDLGAFYANLDLLVLPSINRTEAFGMVQVEAMLCGVPVVASNLPGVRLPVSYTHMGELFTPENYKELAESIAKVLKNKKSYSNESLIRKTEQIFSTKKVVNFYEKLLGDVLSA